MTKIKIGILIDRYNVGGVEKIAIEQVNSLRKIGVDATLVLLTRKAKVENAFLDIRKDIKEIYLDDRLPNFLKINIKFPIFHFFSFFHVLYPFLLPFVLKKNEFDYIIVHGTFTAFSAISFKIFNKISFSTFIWDPIGYILKRVYSDKFFKPIYFFLIKIADFLDKLILEQSDFILVGGKAHNKYLKKINKELKIFVIPPSVHCVKKMSYEKSSYILMLTAWKKGKNPEYIIELVKKIPNLKIKMVGKWIDSNYEDYFRDFLKKNNISKNIEIIGSVDEGELAQYYGKALVFLQTNDDKGFGMPAMEAASYGTTFIIPKGQGVCELFENNKHGFFTVEKDTKNIARLLGKLLKKPELAISMGELARKAVAKNYSWEKHAEILKNIIEKKYEKK